MRRQVLLVTSNQVTTATLLLLASRKSEPISNSLVLD